MATPLTHAAAAVVLGKILLPRQMPWKFWIAAVVVAVLPDLDTAGMRLGVPYASMFGHRGFFHSLLFVTLLSLVAAVIVSGPKWMSRPRLGVWLVLLAGAATHPLLDMLTNGGYGVALFSPFDTARYFFPWQPLAVSPIGIRAFLSARGAEVIVSEVLVVWLPAIALAALARGVAWAVGRLRRHGRDGELP